MEKRHVFYQNGKEIDVTNTKNVWFETTDEKIVCKSYAMRDHFNSATRKWENGETLATPSSPILYLTTNNKDEMVLRYALVNLKGAKMLDEQMVPNWDEDPYGNRVKHGIIVRQKWDLSECFSK